jgi:hypothetical protein
VIAVTGTWGGDTTNPDEKERAAAMDADIITLRRQRVPFDEIGRKMFEKYGRVGANGDPDKPFTKQYISERYRAALAAIPAREAASHRAELTELLNELIDVANGVMRREHVAVSQGRVVREGRPFINDDGEAAIDEGRGAPVLDDGPRLQAAAEIRKVADSIARLHGLNIPVRQEFDVSTQLNIKINGVDLNAMK